jgi:hypothetical protein
VATETRTRSREDSTSAAREDIERTEEAAVDASTANKFDVRRVIGGLFVIYGAILSVVGFGASGADLRKADGININLWTGACMFVGGLVFLAWALWRPVGAELAAEDQDEGARSA